MNIKEMHYDFKKKINKIDTEQYRNFLVPEIDWTLNEAQELFVKMLIKPRKRSYLGFELNQRTIDDIKTLVIHDKCLDIYSNICVLPQNYWYYLSGEVKISKGNCKGVKARLHIRQHDDEFENSLFDKSSFEWRTVNAVFCDEGIKLYDDGTFTNYELCISYIKKLSYIHNAEDFKDRSYALPGKERLIGFVNCQLPEHTHREIVDIAVLIATGEIGAPDYKIKMQKLNLNNLNT